MKIEIFGNQRLRRVRHKKKNAYTENNLYVSVVEQLHFAAGWTAATLNCYRHCYS